MLDIIGTLDSALALWSAASIIVTLVYAIKN